MVVDFHPAFASRVTNDPFLTADLLRALNETVPTSVRLHPKKVRPAFEHTQAIAWCRDAYYLQERPKFTLSPLFHAGSYYPQEAGSMLLDHALRQLDLPESPKILDLCAAPGGKSTLIASFLNGNGLLVANEVIHARSRILKETISKWGFTNTLVTNNDPADFERIPNFFDVVVIDAPCSGEGMFRKDPNARSEWSEDNVKLCAARQKRIVSGVWDSIREGGYLIYSTCTFNEEENENNIQWILENWGGTLVDMNLPETVIHGRNGTGAYGIPGKSQTEGFFMAIIRKGSERKEERKIRVKKPGISVLKDALNIHEFANISNVDLVQWSDYSFAIPKDSFEVFALLQENLRVVKMGTELGTIARKGVIPSHDVAMNFELRMPQESIELTEAEALNYLHGDTFLIDAKQGLKMVTFQKEPLGWIKHLGNRFNNLYPKEWRIKMDVN